MDILNCFGTSKKGDMEVRESVRNEALQKIRELISDANICMITNNILEWSLQPESLNNQRLDEYGNIWFMYFNPSNEESVLIDGRMEIFYSNRLKSKFLSLVGEISWAPLSEIEDLAKFPVAEYRKSKGVDTPIRLARFVPIEAYYWDDVVKDMIPLILFNENKAMVA